MKIVLFIFFYFLLFFNGKCKKEGENCHRTITIINNSNQNVIPGFVSINTSNKCNLSGSVLKSGESYEDKLNECWESRITAQYPYDLYIVDPAQFNTPLIFYICDSIEIKNKVLKHYVLTLDDLKKSNFTVTYP